MDKLYLKDMENAKKEITLKQKREIKRLYEDWAKDVGDKAKYFKLKETSSSVLSEQQMKELKKMLKSQAKQVSGEISGIAKSGMLSVSDSVVKINNRWLKSIGFEGGKIDAAFSNVPDDVVRNLITGKVYNSGWSLSKSIWGDYESTLKDVYNIAAAGVAQNKSAYEISSQLERYVNPNKALKWNLKDFDGKHIYKRAIDYNAQRLVRTLIQHSYQQAYVSVTKDNPFILNYIWRANGSRVCPICRDMDGQVFSKDEVPLDHPNGMCILEPTVSKTLVDDLANWFNNPYGTFPEIDKFARKFM